MNNPWIVYEVFNRVEGVLWFLVALALPFALKPVSRRQKLSLLAASVGFVLFGLSDFMEAPAHGQLPLWLWCYKILCAAYILSCRYFYIGWKNFRLTDRYLIFGLCCLAASLGVIFLQHYLYGS